MERIIWQNLLQLFPLFQARFMFKLYFQAIFQRYPQPDKEYQSFSLIYKDRSLDLVRISVLVLSFYLIYILDVVSIFSSFSLDNVSITCSLFMYPMTDLQGQG